MVSTPLISVVDDNDAVRESLRGLIRSVGFAVEDFPSAEKFLNSDHLNDTHCLILDVCMPGMGGLELQRRLVKSNHNIPIIFITAHGNEADRSKALRDGAVDYLFKPFSEQVLLNAINVALGFEVSRKQNRTG